MGLTIFAIVVGIGLLALFIRHEIHQSRLIGELQNNLEGTLEDFSTFKDEAVSMLTDVQERTKKLSNPSEREKQLVRECDEKWQVAILEQSEQFDKQLKEAYKKACDSISFHTIEYKKTIQKNRRKEYRKKKPTKSSSPYRSIDDAWDVPE